MQVVVAVPVDARAVWTRLADWSAPYFGLEVLTSGSGVGSTRTMKDDSGTYLERLLAQCNERMELSYTIEESPLPSVHESHIAHVHVESHGAGRCVVRWSMYWAFADRSEAAAEREAELVAAFSHDFVGFIEAAARAAVPKSRGGRVGLGPRACVCGVGDRMSAEKRELTTAADSVQRHETCASHRCHRARRLRTCIL
jgi:hypothetical protein